MKQGYEGEVFGALNCEEVLLCVALVFCSKEALLGLVVFEFSAHTGDDFLLLCGLKSGELSFPAQTALDLAHQSGLELLSISLHFLKAAVGFALSCLCRLVSVDG